MKAADAGARIWDCLGDHPAGLNSKMLLHHANLNRGQLRRGLDYINDLFEDESDAPILSLYRGGEWIYIFAQTERDAREFWERRLRGQITRARREHNQWNKTAQKFPTFENERQLELARRRLVDLRYAYDRLFGQGHLEAEVA
jgi:hypothetical protein